MSSGIRNAVEGQGGFTLNRPRHLLVRRALGPASRRISEIRAHLSGGARKEEFDSWLSANLIDEQARVGRAPGRLGRMARREESGWSPLDVFAVEIALAEWTLGRVAMRLVVKEDRILRILEGLPLPVMDLNWPREVLPAEAEREFLPGDPSALASSLYHRLLPRPVRHDLGVYHTPASLAGFVVNLVLEQGGGAARHWSWMDPSCGFGVFLFLVAETLGPDWPSRLSGRDVSPLAVAHSRAVLLEFSLSRLHMDLEEATKSVLDAVRLEDVLFSETPVAASDRVDVLLGNPPWVTWDRLVPSYRERIKALVEQRPDLYDRHGFSVVMGGATDDISGLFTALAAERFLKDEGFVVMLLKKALLTNETGSWFRALAEGPSSVRLTLARVEDLSACPGLFGVGGQKTMVYLAEKGGASRNRVPVGIWVRKGRRVLFSRQGSAERQDSSLPGSPWSLVGQTGRGASSRRPDKGREGEWAYARRIHHGLKHDAEDLFVFTRIEPLESGIVLAWPKHGDEPVPLETARLFRYVKPRHIQAWRIRGWEYVLVPQDRAGARDEEAFAQACPAAFAYLQSRSERLAERKSRVFQSGPFYGMFGLGDYTWAEHRLLWSGLGFRPLFAPASAEPDPLLGDAPLLPDSGCYSLALDDETELWYLAGLLNSNVGRKALQSVALGSKRPLSKAAMSRLSLPAFDRSRKDMIRLAELARRAAEAATEGFLPGLLTELERMVDTQVESLLS